MSGSRWIMALLLLVAVAGTSACTPEKATSAIRGSNTITTTMTASDSSSSETGSSRVAAQLSSTEIAAAKKLGGRSHKGESLYLVVATTSDSETVARSRLNEAIPHFGDTANYFVVQASDSFSGMQPGSFVVAEAYAKRADAQEALDWWSGRVEADWYQPRLVGATRLSSDPIPVVNVDVGPPRN